MGRGAAAQTFSEEHPKAQVGRVFVHQITREWLLFVESTGAGEVDWQGFSDAPDSPMPPLATLSQSPLPALGKLDSFRYRARRCWSD